MLSLGEVRGTSLLERLFDADAVDDEPEDPDAADRE